MPEIGAIWIPTPESLSVKVDEKLIQKRKLDPAMILKVRGNSYLIQTWTVDKEEPFEHHLKKYISSSSKKELTSLLKGRT